MHRSITSFLIAGAAGLILWGGTAIIGGGREPWDTSFYWTTAYPIALGISAALGLVYPHRAWR